MASPSLPAMRPSPPSAASPSAASPTVAVALAAVAVAVAAVLATGLLDHAAPPASAELLFWVAVAGVAAIHRPLAGSSLGLGALALAPVAYRHGAVATALVAAGGYLVAEATRRAVRGRHRESSPAPAPAATVAERAATLTLAGLVGAVAAGLVPVTTTADVGRAALAGGVAHAVLGLALAAAMTRLGGRHERVAWSFLVDAAGWWLGGLVVTLGQAPPGGAWPQALALAAALALLSAEAARQRLLLAASEGRAGRLDGLHGAHERLLAETGMAAIADRVLAECRDVLPVAHFQLELLSGEGGRSWAAGPDGRLFEGTPRPPAQPPALPGIHRRAAWRVVDRRLDAGGETLAALRLWCDPRLVDPRSEELLDRLLPQMASSLHRALLDREAKLDPLTGVPVRRVLEARLRELYQDACENGGTMAVVMCDVDHFKRINDTHGHAAGDAALVAVARALEAARREDDLLCRFGGEEFTVLLPATDGRTALEIADRLRRSVAAVEIDHEGEPLTLRLSAGVAAFPELCARTASELLLLADEALYQAKERGRDRAVLALGNGGFRDAQGRGDAAPPPVVAPRIFS